MIRVELVSARARTKRTGGQPVHVEGWTAYVEDHDLGDADPSDEVDVTVVVLPKLSRLDQLGLAIERGDLPWILEGADPARYRVYDHPPTWEGWISAWRGILWVRRQAFERLGDACAAADDYFEAES